MYKDIVQEYIKEINSDFEISKQIANAVNRDKNLIETINNSTIISMCIKYEAFTSDLMSKIRRRQVTYNHPWSYTRAIAKILNVDISRQYKVAHDVWDYYNTLKHVNHATKVEELKIKKEYNINNSWDALRFVHNALIELLNCFL